MFKKIIVILSLVCSSVCLADPAPFGLELGKTTIEQAKKKYTLTSNGTSQYSKGEMYWVAVSELNFDGLQSALLIFEQDQTLSGILTVFPKEKFDYLMKSLSSKYQLVRKKIPFVGHSTATFHNGKTEITLDAPHLSFEMEMSYITDAFLKRMEAMQKKEQQQRQQQESSQL